MRIVSTLMLALFVWSGPLSVAASEPIEIGEVRASLGDDKEMLLESLRTKYTVLELLGETFVVSKGDPSANTVGIVKFIDGKLVWASRDVGAFDGEAVRKFAQTLFQVLATVNAEDRSPILITTQISTADPIALGSLTLEFPGRQVVVDIAYDNSLVAASIEEILFDESAREDQSSAADPAPGRDLPAATVGMIE